MGLWSLITLPIRTGVKTVLLCLSIVWFSLRLTWTITFLIPLFGYLASVLSTSAVLAAAQTEPDALHALNRLLPIRQLRFVTCILMAAVTEVPHFIILFKIGVILYVKVLGVLNYWLGFLFMLLDVVNIGVLVYFYAENLQSVNALTSHFKVAKDDAKFSIGSMILKSLSPSYVVRDREQLQIYSGVKFYDLEAMKDPSIAALQKHDEGLLDVYTYGSRTTSLKPVIVYVHGGAWTMGSKNLPTPFYNILAESGFVVVSVNYRLAPRYPQPAGFNDIMLAVSWTRANIAAFGGDKNFIVMAGDSAGGHLAQLATLTSAERKEPVQGSILLYPVVDVVDEFDMDPARKRFFVNTVCGGDETAAGKLGLVKHINSGVETSPVLVFHGDHDSLVKHATVVEMQRRLKEAGSTLDLVTLKKTHHAYTVFNSPRAIASCQLAADWAMKLFKDQKKSQ